MTVLQFIGKSEKFCACLSRLINHSFELGAFAKELKKGRVIPECLNQVIGRMLTTTGSLGPCLSKTCEVIVFTAFSSRLFLIEKSCSIKHNQVSGIFTQQQHHYIN